MADEFYCVIFRSLIFDSSALCGQSSGVRVCETLAAVEDGLFVNPLESKGHLIDSNHEWLPFANRLLGRLIISFCHQSVIKPFRLTWAYIFITAVLILFDWFLFYFTVFRGKIAFLLHAHS